jgi:hypothetical protein
MVFRVFKEMLGRCFDGSGEKMSNERIQFLSDQIAKGNLRIRRRSTRREVLQRLLDRIFLNEAMPHEHKRPSGR